MGSDSAELTVDRRQQFLGVRITLMQLDEKPELDASLEVLLELHRRNPNADPVLLAGLLRDATVRYCTNAPWFIRMDALLVPETLISLGNSPAPSRLALDRGERPQCDPVALVPEIGFTTCRAKLAEVLEKILKAELIRLGWPPPPCLRARRWQKSISPIATLASTLTILTGRRSAHRSRR